MFSNRSVTRVADVDKRQRTTYDLAVANHDHVVEVRTHHSTYRFVFRHDARVVSDRVSGMALTSNNRKVDDRVKTNVDRVVVLGEELRFGETLSSRTSPVQSVTVGGKRVLG